MDTLLAIELNRRAKEAKSRARVFDWNKAAKLIKDRKPKFANAGLKDDWEWTGGVIFLNGGIVRDSYTFLQSNWAEPQITLDNGDPISCWVYADTVPWDAQTKWPDSALDILPEEMRKEVSENDGYGEGF